MEVSSTTNSQNAAIEAQKKAQEVQQQQVLKTLDDVKQQSQQDTAQKTGMGNSLNLLG